MRNALQSFASTPLILMLVSRAWNRLYLQNKQKSLYFYFCKPYKKKIKKHNMNDYVKLNRQQLIKKKNNSKLI